MSGTEDYLDKLLNSVVDKEGGPADPQGAAPDSDDDFMKGFENDFLSGDDADDFLRQFEQEFAEEKEEPGTGTFSAENGMLDSLDGIVSSVQQETDAGQAPEEDDIMVDTLGDIPENRAMQAGQEEDSLGFMDSLDSLVDEVSAAGEQSEADTVSSPMESDQDLMKLLQSDEEIQESAEMGMQDDVNSDFGHSGDGLEDSFFGGDSGENELSLDDGDKKGKKESFFAKLSRILFGEDEDEQENTAESANSSSVTGQEDIAGDDFGILQEFGAMSSPSAAPAPEPEEDAGGKKKKKEKVKKEKKPREKKPRKEKKPKPPKEPDNTPPLPKVPVILTFVMVASFMVLVLVATNLMGYSNRVRAASDAYAMGDYQAAYQEIAGLSAKEKDTENWEKYELMAEIDGNYRAYQSLTEAQVYDMALDALITAVGKCSDYAEEAEAYGCTSELERTKSEAVAALGSFGISEETALEVYSIDDRENYSIEVYRILESAGLSGGQDDSDN